jgi:hypothetical protein
MTDEEIHSLVRQRLMMGAAVVVVSSRVYSKGHSKVVEIAPELHLSPERAEFDERIKPGQTIDP